MKKLTRRLVTLALSGAILGGCISAVTASAREPYDVYSYDRWGEAIPSQAGYIAERAVSGYDLGVGAFESPSDIFYDHNDIFYVVDSGNDRIVAVDSDFREAVRVYDSFTMPDGSQTKLKNPQGIFISADNDLMYIADNENARVLVCDTDGNVVREITKPDSEIYDQKRTFLPQRVIADKAGNVYIVLGNITTGAAMFDPEGEFIGFYGANRVQPTAEIVSNYVTSLFASEEKRARRTRNVPTGITSFDIDGDCTPMAGTCEMHNQSELKVGGMLKLNGNTFNGPTTAGEYAIVKCSKLYATWADAISVNGRVYFDFDPNEIYGMWSDENRNYRKNMNDNDNDNNKGKPPVPMPQRLRDFLRETVNREENGPGRKGWFGRLMG